MTEERVSRRDAEGKLVGACIRAVASLHSRSHTNEISNLPEIACGIAVALPQVFGRTIGDEMA